MPNLKLNFEYEIKEKPISAKVKPYGRGSGRISFDGISKYVGEEVIIGVLKK